MSSQPKTFITPEEYLEIERTAERKSEYYQGEMFAMAGGTPRHAWIVANLIGGLWQQLKGRPCRVASSDLQLRVSTTGLYTYPDVMVVCGEPQFPADQRNSLLNPSVIIEVLSDSTGDYDLGRKFRHYRTLPSLRDYLTAAAGRWPRSTTRSISPLNRRPRNVRSRLVPPRPPRWTASCTA
jgi:Uma2 family endonuclease